MPHQCTNCGHVFADGSKEMLSGCPSCGGNKFQFKPGSVEDFATDSTAQPEPADGQSPPTATDTQQTSSQPPTTGSADQSDLPPETEGFGRDAEFVENETTSAAATDPPAQSTARSDVVSSDELPAAGRTQSRPTQAESPQEPPAQPSDSATTTQPVDERSEQPPEQQPSADHEGATLDQLRQELNNQFESIRIVSPGQYELNLMELYDRDEYIISLREDGRYVIEVPDGWGADDSV